MNRADLDARNTAAIRRHARSLADNDMRATRPLLDDLAAITEEYATAHAKRVTARRELREQAATPLPAAPTTLIDDYGHPASEGGTAIPETPEAAERREARVRGEGPSSHRTRTRTRGGPK